MHAFRIWLVAGIASFMVGGWASSQETNNDQKAPEEPFPKPLFAPALNQATNAAKAPAFPGPKRLDPRVLKTLRAPVLKKVDAAALKPVAISGDETNAAEEEETDAAGEDETDVAGEEELDEADAGAPGPFTALNPASGNRMVGLKYDDWDVNEVLKDYSDWTGLALMKAPNLPSPKITLKCPKRLPMSEALLAIESILAMHGIGLVPMGDKFLKVVPIATARQDGMAISTGEIKTEEQDTDHLVSQIVELKHIEIAEAQNTIQNLLHPYGKIMPLDRVNCMLITDTAVNIKRILEILQYLDQPIESREELRIFNIVYAKASEIQGKIQAIVADTEARDAKTTFIRQQLASAQMPTRSTRQPQPGQPQPTQPLPSPTPTRPSVMEVAEPSEERGLIHAKVKMVADDRTGSLIIITRAEQFQFLENIIKALDRQVDPDVTIKVFRLQYASAKDVVSVLNALISSASKSAPGPMPPPEAVTGAGKKEAGKSSEEIQISGRLSQDVKIIADSRINALLVMASKSDMAVIEDVMTNIDIMLSQVLIEVVIVEIGLSDSLQSGIDWLQRSMIAYNEKNGSRNAFMGFAGTSKEGADAEITDGTSIRTIGDSTAAAGSGLSYYFTFFDLNMDVVLNMLAQNTEARLLSTPIILTTDNKEARIMVGEKRPIVTSTSITSGGTQQSAYEYTDIGIELTVTPHINKKGFVVMDILQSIDNVGDYAVIDGNNVPVITTREFGASLAVDDGRTIVVGGLMSSDKMTTRSGIPWLSKIPLLGRLFRSDYDDKTRRELLVMITPYVLDTPNKVYEETTRRKGSIEAAKDLLIQGWSGSELLKPLPKEGDGEEKDEQGGAVESGEKQE